MTFDAPLTSWFRRAVALTGNTAERTQSERVQKRAWTAAGASGYATLQPNGWSKVSVDANRFLDQFDIPPDDAEGIDGLLRDLLTLAPSLPWRPSTRTGDGGTDVALVDLMECLDVPLAGAGIMLLGNHIGYPEHQHPPEELYLILSGRRRWRFGGSDRYVLTEPGQVLSNSSNDLHGVEPGEDLLLAFWILIDENHGASGNA